MKRLLIGALFFSLAAVADVVAVQHVEGTVHGFLVLRTLDGKTLAAGDLIQTVQGDRLVSNLVFHFRDGSIDDETTVFSQHRYFRMLSDRHIQKGPSFPRALDVAIDSATGRVTVRSNENGKEKVETEHLDLSPDLSNGMLLNLLKNFRSDVTEARVSWLVATPKPRLVKLAITPQGEDTFWSAETPRKAMRFRIKVELGGLTGLMAGLLGKQPKDIQFWVLGGKAPAFVRMEGQFYEDGPVWSVEVADTVWRR